MVLQDQSLRELPKVSAAEFWNAYDNYVLKAEMFDEEGRLFLKQPDDFVTTQTDRTHSPLEWMIYRQQNSRLVVRPRKITQNCGEPSDTLFG